MSKSMLKSEQLLRIYKVVKVKLNQNIHLYENIITFIHSDERHYFIWRLSRDTKCIFAKSARTCVTSPPYYGLRDYGTATWIGGDPNCKHRKVGKQGSNCITGHKNHDDMGS